MKKFWLAGLGCLLSMPLWAQPAPVAVIVAPVQSAGISERYEALATVQPRESVLISSSVDDIVAAIHFQEGQSVMAGQLLLEQSQQVEKANLQAAQAQQAEKRSAMARVQELAAKGLASPAELDLARAALQLASAQLRAREAELAQRNIRAPFAGVLGLREVSLGSYLRAGDTVTRLQDLSAMKLEFTLPQNWATALGSGLQLRAREPGATRYFSLATPISDGRLDPQTRSLRVRAQLESDAFNPLPGSLMLVELSRPQRQSLLVPESALVPGPTGQRVFVVRDGKAQDINVIAGLRRDGQVEILEGLQAAQDVVVHGSDKLRRGSAVRIRARYDGSRPMAELIRAEPAQP